jgi:hypothetical protein
VATATATATPASTAQPAAPLKPTALATQKRVRAKTIEGLKTVRMNPRRPIYFMLCVGNARAVPYLARVIGSSHKTMLRPLMGNDTGLKYHRGQCIFERGLYMFVGPTVAPGMRRKLEAGLLALTGRRFPARLRRAEIEPPAQSSDAGLPV